VISDAGEIDDGGGWGGGTGGVMCLRGVDAPGLVSFEDLLRIIYELYVAWLYILI
jgi:hypothetical protein